MTHHRVCGGSGVTQPTQGHCKARRGSKESDEAKNHQKLKIYPKKKD